MPKLHLLEILPVTIYLIAILVIGFIKKEQPGSDDYFLGGRRLTLPGFVATLVTTWYGGILGVGEFTYLYGIANWLVFGAPYYLFAFLFAIYIAPRVQSTPHVSIPDQFYHHYGKVSGMLSSIYTFFVVLPAPYVLMVGFLLMWITGWPLWLCVCMGAIFSMAYVVSGGFQAVVRTDKLQFLLMFGGFIVLFIVLVFSYGGLPFLRQHLPSTHLTWHGGNSLQTIIVWFFIAAWTFVDPGFYQRCYAARTPGVARRGIMVSIGFWFVFDLLTTFCGLYARALLSGEMQTPALSFPMLSHQVLPPLLSGLFLAGLLATIMSTVDSFTHLSAIALGHDLLKKIFPDHNEQTLIRTGLVLSALVSIILAIAVPSVIEIWLLIGNIFLPPLLFPIIASYYPRLNPGSSWVTANMILAFFASLTWLFISFWASQSLTAVQFFLEIPPMYPGMLVSITLFSLGLFLRKRT